MLYHRGFPSDAIRMYRSALDVDKGLVEAWLRIGLVQQSQGEFDDADQAYRRCLKKSPGHGWCNFYLGLLEEKRGHGKSAAYYLEQAFKHAPRLADPYYNPAVLDSKLALGAELINFDRRKMQAGQPMPYLQPRQVERVRRQYEPEAPEKPEEPALTEESQPAPATSIVVSSTPESEVNAGQQHPITPNYGSPTPAPQRPPRSIPVRRVPSPSYERPYGSGETGRSAGEEPPVAPPIGSVSGEARLLPYGTALSDLIDWLV
jgi:tetratricopeptide (TPR) repeat protein